MSVVGGEPLPSAFVTFVRYQFLTLFAFIAKGLTALKNGGSSAAATSSPAASSGGFTPERPLGSRASAPAHYLIA